MTPHLAITSLASNNLHTKAASLWSAYLLARWEADPSPANLRAVVAFGARVSAHGAEAAVGDLVDAWADAA